MTHQPNPPPFHYPTASLWGDYVRAGAGLVLTLPPLALVPMLPVVAGIFAISALAFALFGLRTWARHKTKLWLDGPMLRIEGLRPRTLDLARLQKFDLRFYSTRRDRDAGWMQLSLADDHQRVTVESTLTDFDRLLDVAVSAAQAHGLRLSDRTVGNLIALGYPVAYQPDPEPQK